MQKLNQVIAIEKGVKSKSKSRQTELYKAVQKPALFDGVTKKYSPLKEGGETFPTENKRVQMNARDLLKEISKILTELVDVEATKDFANCHATADVVVDGVVLISNAPATFLLSVEKELTDLFTLIQTIPTLDPAEEWSQVPESNLWRTAPTQSIKTAKIQDAIVLIEPTKEHPGQAQLITKDVTVGTWEQVKLSGAMPENVRQRLLVKVEKLQRAVKYAREQANMTEAPQMSVGEKVFGWLFE